MLRPERRDGKSVTAVGSTWARGIYGSYPKVLRNRVGSGFVGLGMTTRTNVGVGFFGSPTSIRAEWRARPHWFDPERRVYRRCAANAL